MNSHEIYIASTFKKLGIGIKGGDRDVRRAQEDDGEIARYGIDRKNKEA